MTPATAGPCFRRQFGMKLCGRKTEEVAEGYGAGRKMRENEQENSKQSDVWQEK